MARLEFFKGLILSSKPANGKGKSWGRWFSPISRHRFWYHDTDANRSLEETPMMQRTIATPSSVAGHRV
jgi:hypothetical protein